MPIGFGVDMSAACQVVQVAVYFRLTSCLPTDITFHLQKLRVRNLSPVWRTFPLRPQISHFSRWCSLPLPLSANLDLFVRIVNYIADLVALTSCFSTVNVRSSHIYTKYFTELLEPDLSFFGHNYAHNTMSDHIPDRGAGAGASPCTIETEWSLVNSKTGLTDLLRLIATIPTDDLEKDGIVVDLEGNNLCRYGTISLVQLNLPGTNETFLVDVTVLKHVAFETTISVDGKTISLKSLLESPKIIKILFDCRNDSNALYFLYGVALQGVQDVQLMADLSCGNLRTTHLMSLRSCIDRHLKIDQGIKDEALKLKARVKSMFDNGYGIFDARPLCEDLQRYSANDVRYLRMLRNTYWSWLSGRQEEMVEIEAANRVAESQTLAYDPYGPIETLKDKRLSPFWAKWRDNDGSVLHLYAEMGGRAVCEKSCKNYWGQIHECDGCACTRACEQKRRLKCKRWQQMTWEEQEEHIALIKEKCGPYSDEEAQFGFDSTCTGESRLWSLLQYRREKLERKEARIQKGLNTWLAEWDAWASHKYQFPTPLTAEEDFELVSRNNGAPALPTMLDSPFARSIRAKLIRQYNASRHCAGRGTLWH
jgi:exonuclease 3'-5' domain-containing protein 1